MSDDHEPGEQLDMLGDQLRAAETQRDEAVRLLEDILDNAKFDTGDDGTWGYDPETKRVTDAARAYLARIKESQA